MGSRTELIGAGLAVNGPSTSTRGSKAVFLCDKLFRGWNPWSLRGDKCWPDGGLETSSVNGVEGLVLGSEGAPEPAVGRDLVQHRYKTCGRAVEVPSNGEACGGFLVDRSVACLPPLFTMPHCEGRWNSRSDAGVRGSNSSPFSERPFPVRSVGLGSASAMPASLAGSLFEVSNAFPSHCLEGTTYPFWPPLGSRAPRGRSSPSGCTPVTPSRCSSSKILGPPQTIDYRHLGLVNSQGLKSSHCDRGPEGSDQDRSGHKNDPFHGFWFTNQLTTGEPAPPPQVEGQGRGCR